MTFSALVTIGKPVTDVVREVIYENTIPGDDEFKETVFIAREWSRCPTSHFMKLSNGTLAGIRGRIEKDETLGFILVIEHYTTLANKKIDKHA